MSIKISVLSDLEPITVGSYDETVGAVRAGIDGLVLTAGPHRATLLPSVWPKVRTRPSSPKSSGARPDSRPATGPAGHECSRYTTEEFRDPGPR